MSTQPLFNQAFLDCYGPIMTCEELGHALIRVLDDRLAARAQEREVRANRVIGLHWDMTYTKTLPYWHSADKPTAGYVGKIWIRFAHDYVGNPGMMLRETGYRIGVGGYSTWQGPWQDRGRQFNQYEAGVPYNLRKRDMAAFAFASQFYVEDFPGIDQTFLMAKLSDQPIIVDSRFKWEVPGLEQADEDYIAYLKEL